MTRDGRESQRVRRPDRPTISLAEAFIVLGLSPGAERSVMRATYRRLALKYHPDRNAGDGRSLERFKQLATAYRIIEKKYRLDRVSPDQVCAECDRCGEYAVVHKGLDGSRCCAECLSVANRRLSLPAPPITVVTCATTIVLLALAGGCLAAGWYSGDGSYLLAAFALGMLSLVALGATCVSVIYTTDPRPSRRRPSIQTVQHRRRAVPVRERADSTS